MLRSLSRLRRDKDSPFIVESQTINTMETYSNTPQEEPAQPIIADAPRIEEEIAEEEHPAEEERMIEEQPAAEPLYNRAEADAIVRYLTEEGLFDPEYILLFGSLAGGTPHSEAKSYDLLLVVGNLSVHDWMDAKRDLRYKLPYSRRKVTYVNLYVCPLSYVRSHRTPFLDFAHREGVLLYCKDTFYFRRPKRLCNFGAALCDARSYFETFMPLADLAMKAASTCSPASPTELRWSAFMTAQAGVLYYKILHYVYHNRSFDGDDPLLLHERMRTLSTELMLLFDSSHTRGNATLVALKRFGRTAFGELRFEEHPLELKEHMERVVRLGGIVERCCRKRLELYGSLCGE